MEYGEFSNLSYPLLLKMEGTNLEMKGVGELFSGPGHRRSHYSRRRRKLLYRITQTGVETEYTEITTRCKVETR